ncbi:HPP family protein [Sporobolomyces koalae]|uniref:HPP family protein n=1 Tax=Sporobolomyces koalae TaxID=500713 RepID=UPI00317B03EC
MLGGEGEIGTRADIVWELGQLSPETEDFFYAIWPLSRFVGYRPPTFPEFDDSFHSKLVYQLPTRYHQKHIEELKRRAEQYDEERRGDPAPRASGETLVQQQDEKAKRDKDEVDKEKSDKKRHRFKDKLVHMIVTYLASFAAIAFLALSARAAIFANRGAPVVVAAFATEAVILYSEFQSPLAQPRNIMFGNILCSVLGVGLQKLFLLHGGWKVGDIFGPLPWAAASVTLATSILLMQFFEITHPPGGATALLAVTLPSVAGMGWFFIVQVVVDSCIVLGWAMIVNNMFGRQYPTNWWWPTDHIVIPPRPSKSG